MCCLRKFAYPRAWRYSPMFASRNLLVLPFIFKAMIHLKLILCHVCSSGSHLIFSPLWISQVSASVVEKIILSPTELYCCFPCESDEHISGSFSALYFVTFVYLSCHQYHSVLITTGLCKFSNFVLQDRSVTYPENSFPTSQSLQSPYWLIPWVFPWGRGVL